MARRSFLRQLMALPVLGIASGMAQTASRKPLNIMMKSAWGPDDPTRAAFPFAHGLALAEAGHEVQIFLLGEAVVVMRKVVAEAVTPVGWPKVAETLDKLAACRNTTRSLDSERLVETRTGQPVTPTWYTWS